VSWWPGDTSANDIVGGNNGILRGGASFTDSLVAQGFELDGEDDYVEVSSDADLNNSGEFTVELWAKRTKLGESVVVSKGEHGGRSFFVKFTSGDKIQVGYDATDGSPVVAPPGGGPEILGSGYPPITDSQFHHIALRVQNSRSVYLFVDGVHQTTISYGNRKQPADASASPFVIGALSDSQSPTGFSAFFGGVIDEVTIYNRALDIQEVKSIFYAGRGGKTKP
jgi:hypothetical protein